MYQLEVFKMSLKISKKIGVTIAIATLLIGFAAPSIISYTGPNVDQEMSLDGPPEDEVPLLDVSSMPALIQSLADGADYFVSIAPQVVILIINMLVGMISVPMEPEELVVMFTDLIKVVIETLPSWPELTPFHPAWLAELDTVFLSAIPNMPRLLKALPGFGLTFIEAFPGLLVEILGVLGDEMPILWDVDMWLDIIRSYVPTAVPDLLYAIPAGIRGLITSLPNIISKWIGTMKGGWVEVGDSYLAVMPDLVPAILTNLANFFTYLPDLLSNFIGMIVDLLLTGLKMLVPNLIAPFAAIPDFIFATLTAAKKLIVTIPESIGELVDFVLALPTTIIGLLQAIPGMILGVVDFVLAILVLAIGFLLTIIPAIFVAVGALFQSILDCPSVIRDMVWGFVCLPEEVLSDTMDALGAFS